MKEDLEFLVQILDDLNKMKQEVEDGTRTQSDYESSVKFWKRDIQNSVDKILQD